MRFGSHGEIVFAAASRGNNPATILSDDDHHLFALTYAVSVTQDRLTHSTTGWGDPDPHHIPLDGHATITTVARIGPWCAFELAGNVNQSFFDRNVNESAFPFGSGGPQNASATLMNLKFMYNISFVGTSIVFNYTVAVGNLQLSDAAWMYEDWNRPFCYGGMASVAVHPRLLKGSANASLRDSTITPRTASVSNWWGMEALGNVYDVFDFFADGTCNYHVTDVAYLCPTKGCLIENSTTLRWHVNTTGAVRVESPDIALVLFGWQNATWASTVDPITYMCTPGLESGVSFNLWNQWNANWVAGFPWNPDDARELTFRINMEYPFFLTTP